MIPSIFLLDTYTGIMRKESRRHSVRWVRWNIGGVRVWLPKQSKKKSAPSCWIACFLRRGLSKFDEFLRRCWIFRFFPPCLNLANPLSSMKKYAKKIHRNIRLYQHFIAQRNISSTFPCLVVFDGSSYRVRHSIMMTGWQQNCRSGALTLTLQLYAFSFAKNMRKCLSPIVEYISEL